MPELVIILVIALIIFGPRKLPELGKSLGKSINEFKKASTELQNTLEKEIQLEEQKEKDEARAKTAAVDAGPGRHRRRRHPRPARVAERSRQLDSVALVPSRSRRTKTSLRSATTTAAPWSRPTRRTTSTGG